MALGPALGVVDRGLERVGRGIIGKLGVAPSVRVRESLGIFLDELNKLEGIHIVSGVLTDQGASVIFFCVHSSFAILEPLGKDFPLSGIPALYALIITGLATMALSKFEASI